LLRDAARYLGAERAQRVLGLLALQPGERAGDDEGEVREWRTLGLRHLDRLPGDFRVNQVVDHLLVARVGKELRDFLRDDRPHVRGLLDLRGVGLPQRFQVAKLLGQCARRGFAHLRDAEREQEPRQGSLPALVDGLVQAGGILLAKAAFDGLALRIGGHELERPQLRLAERVQVRGRLQAFVVDQLLDQALAQALDVHGAPAGKVQDPFRTLRLALQVTAGALVHRLVFEPHDRRAAHRALRRHHRVARIRRALLEYRTHDFGYHVTGAAHDDGVVDLQVLARDLVHVVQRGVAHGHAADEHRLELGRRRQRAGAPHVEHHVFHDGHFFLGRELVRQRPARRTRHEAELFLVRAAIYLVYNAVDLERQLRAARADVAVIVEASFDAAHLATF